MRIAAHRALSTSLLALGLATLAAPARGAILPAHPRLWLSATGHRGITPATLRARCERPTSPHARACRAAAPLPVPGSNPFRNAEHPLINLALRYLLYEEPEVLERFRDIAASIGPANDGGDPRGAMIAFAPRVRQLAIAYDWLYHALPPDARGQVAALLRSYAEWYLAHPTDDVFASEAYVQASAVGLVGIALAGEAIGGADAARYLAYAENRWKRVLLPALAHAGDWWHEGPGLFNHLAARNTLYFAAAWSTASDEDLFAYVRANAGGLFERWIQYEAYATRPDFRFAPFGDANDQALSHELQSRAVLDMLAWGTGSTIAQAFADEVTRRSRVSADYLPIESWHLLLFYDPARPAAPARDELPTARHLSPTAEDVVVMRSGWGPADTWISLSCGDWFSPRQHLESGSFQIYRRAPLAVSTGAFDGFETTHWVNWYAQHSIHANTLAILRPGELFPNARGLPNVNDGGQRSTHDGTPRLGRATLEEYRANLTAGRQYDTGGVTAFEHSGYHDYAACDATRAYNSTAYASPGNVPKVREVTRQLVFLRPELVVLFDRVESTDATYEKRFLLHGLRRPLLLTADTFSITADPGRLLVRTLLPAATTRTIVEGFRIHDMDYPPLATGNEARGVRIEIAPRAPATRDYFLHVLHATDPSRQTLPPLAYVEEGDLVGTRVADPSDQRIYTVLFRRTGPVAGTLRVAARDGSDLYRGALGAGGTFYAPTLDAGTPDASAPDAGLRDASLDAGSPPPREPDPGCACRAGARPLRPPLALALALAGLARRRPARSRAQKSRSSTPA